MTNSDVTGVAYAQGRARSVVKLDAALLADARAAVRFLRGRDKPELTLGDLLDRLVGEGLERIRHEHNDSQPLSTSGDPLPRGATPQV